MIGMSVDNFPLLPNPVVKRVGSVQKSEYPRVVFLARLDPPKRPWLFAELARMFPEVEFLMAGKLHYHGYGAWEPGELPPNVKLLGHIDGPEKARLLSSSWLLVSTSIHEGLAVSFLEALACETPILALTNPGGVVSNYGHFAGRYDGDGLDSLPSLAAGLDRLLSDACHRQRLGRSGREWVESTHSPERFLSSFRELCARVGVTY